MTSPLSNLSISTELVSEVFEEALRHTNRHSGQHTITVQMADDLLLARMDAKLVVQVLINLVDNAIKYSPEHSTITIRLQKRTGFVRIEIEDQGIGIPQSEYHKIFQRFYRGTAPEVREKSGTGIGLYLSRQIIEQHGGTITVASGKVRKGSTFLIQLPENGLS